MKFCRFACRVKDPGPCLKFFTSINGTISWFLDFSFSLSLNMQPNDSWNKIQNPFQGHGHLLRLFYLCLKMSLAWPWRCTKPLWPLSLEFPPTPSSSLLPAAASHPTFPDFPSSIWLQTSKIFSWPPGICNLVGICFLAPLAPRGYSSPEKLRLSSH